MIKNKSRMWYFELVLIFVFFIAVGISILHSTPWTIGDGYEYILQSVAFRNHFSFGISEEDFSIALQEFPELKRGITNIYNNDLGIADNGLKYSNHFGVYSALVAPVKAILIATHHSPVNAFKITNLFLWFLAAMVVLGFLKTDDKRRLGVLALILFNPVYFYADWIHAETFIFAFVVMGLVFYYNKQHSLGILFISIAAMQNLGILPLGMIIGLDYIWSCYLAFQKESKTKNVWKFVKSDWLHIIPYGLLYLPAMLPMITCYLHFGVFNRVAAVATENKYILEKIWAYLFDLNIGIGVYAPIILIAFIIMAIHGIWQRKSNAILNLLAFIGIVTIISFELHINCGMEGISRYGVWILPQLIFYVAMNFNIDAKALKYYLIIGAEAAFTTVMIYATLWGSPNYDIYTEFAPWTEYVMDKCPQIYNPFHTIFYIRATNIETYNAEVPVVFRNEDGFVRKILLSKNAEDAFFSSPSIIVDTDGNIIDKSSLKKHVVDSGEFTYINMPKNVLEVCNYEIGNDIIYFCQEKYNADMYVKKGTYLIEPWGAWTNGDELEVLMRFEDDTKNLHCHVDVNGTYYQPQPVNVYVNNQKIYTTTIDGDQDIDFDFINPDNGIVNISFELPGAVSPSEISDSNDARILALGLITMEITGS